MAFVLRYLHLLHLLPRLGWQNIFRAISYRLLLRTGLHPVCKLKAELLSGSFFSAVSGSRLLPTTEAWLYSLRYYDWLTFKSSAGPPNWFGKPVSGLSDWPGNQPWWQTVAPNAEEGDIKEIWELSRFHWVIAMAQRAANGDAAEIQRLNVWLSDWVHENPPFLGPNWRCGQEASIRVMNLAAAALVLNQAFASSPLIFTLLRAHLARISATLSYAISQDNNHGVLEAVGLFVGGEWLFTEKQETQARAWACQGRKWVEERALRLISEDGSFSMYSVTYHREFLDALSFAEVWRRRMNLPNFSSRFMERSAAAARWLKAFTHPATGDAPNIGANDGTRLFQFADTTYRDFRPSVQQACVLFCSAMAYEPGPWDLALHWLEIPLPGITLPVDESRQFDDGGFVVLRANQEDVQAFVRYPRFRYRPSQADLLHVDLWVRGENILRDAGSYSYHTESRWLNYFGGTESHNTVQIDGRDQMPRLSRFLFGDWLKSNWLKPLHEDGGCVYFGAGYRDRQGAIHNRSLSLTDGELRVVDEVRGISRKAVLRWRLAPGQWRVSQTPDCVHLINMSKNGGLTLTVRSSVPIMRSEIVEGAESRHYAEKTLLPVLEIEVQRSCTLTTLLGWSD